MTRRTLATAAGAAILLLLSAALAACDTGEPEPGTTSESAASAPLKSDTVAYTRHVVRQAIDMYESDGLDATVEYYNTPESVDGQWYVFIYDENDMNLAHAANPALVNLPTTDAVGPNNYPAGEAVAAVADEAGGWFTYTFPNPETGSTQTKHSWAVRHDGLMFGSGWYEPGAPKSDPAAYTQSVVRQAMALYDVLGAERTAAYYNTPESVDGQWYVFIYDENDIGVAHAVNPALVNSPASVAVGPNGYPVGEALAAIADEAGAWFTYTFHNPGTGAMQTKHSWVVRHDGKIFGSGWYEPGQPKSDPAAYTQTLVRQAMALYDAVGEERTAEYYNTPESVDGQWYVFIFDENDTRIAHPIRPDLLNLPASDTVGPSGYPSPEAVVATADEDGAWFSYPFADPVTGVVRMKHSWSVRHDGLLFGSGWYEAGPPKSDQPAYTQATVQRAIALYDAVGRERTVEYYSSEENVEGQWYVFIVGEDGRTIAHFNPMFIGRDPAERIDSTGYFYGDDLLTAPESGRWISYVLTNPEAGSERRKHTWAVRHDGLIFGSGWYEER